MSDVVSLKVVRKPEKPDEDLRKKLLESFDDYVKSLREFLEKGETCGFAFFGYSRSIDKDGDPNLHTHCNYHVNDTGDGFWLPDAAKMRITNRINGD